MDELKLSLAPRTVIGKKVRVLRRGGMVPVHMYGSGTEDQALQVEAGVLRRILPRAGANIPITVTVDGQDGDSLCFVREVQRHPVTEDLLHADFLRVEATQTITAEVPVILDGEPAGVRDLDGTLMQPFATLTVEALPADMPAAIHVDVSHLDDFEKSVRVGELVVAEGATILRDPDEMVARVLPPRVEEEEPVFVEGEEVEGEEREAGGKGEGVDQRAEETEA